MCRHSTAIKQQTQPDIGLELELDYLESIGRKPTWQCTDCEKISPRIVATCPEAGQGVKILWLYKLHYNFYIIHCFDKKV